MLWRHKIYSTLIGLFKKKFKTNNFFGLPSSSTASCTCFLPLLQQVFLHQERKRLLNLELNLFLDFWNKNPAILLGTNMIEHVHSAGDFVKYVILKIILFLTYTISHIYDYLTYPFYFIYYHPWLVRQYKREGNYLSVAISRKNFNKNYFLNKFFVKS